MGIIVREIAFDGKAPSAPAIADAIREVCGLPVQVQESRADVKGAVYDMNARLAFECAPEERLEVYSSEANEHAVHLRGHVGQESTLFWVTVLALERLGGRDTRSMTPEVRARYGGTLTPALLRRRLRKAHASAILVMAGGVVLLPIFVLILLAEFAGASLRVFRWRRRF